METKKATADAPRRERRALIVMAASGAFGLALAAVLPDWQKGILMAMALVWLLASASLSRLHIWQKTTLKDVYHAAHKGELSASWTAYGISFAALTLFVAAFFL